MGTNFDTVTGHSPYEMIKKRALNRGLGTKIIELPVELTYYCNVTSLWS